MDHPDTPPTDSMQALADACEKAGTSVALARGLGVSLNTPSMWKARGRIPAEYCPSIERLTGVTCERLCPDVEWEVLRKPARKQKA